MSFYKHFNVYYLSSDTDTFRLDSKCRKNCIVFSAILWKSVLVSILRTSGTMFHCLVVLWLPYHSIGTTRPIPPDRRSCRGVVYCPMCSDCHFIMHVGNSQSSSHEIQEGNYTNFWIVYNQHAIRGVGSILISWPRIFKLFMWLKLQSI